MSLWIKNAKIATMNDQMPEASSAVVIGDFFAYVGDEQGAVAFLREHPQQNLQELDLSNNALNDLLPQKMIPVMVELSGIPERQKVNEITREQRRALLQLLKHFPIAVAGLRPVTDAIITSGGIKISEINPTTMESKIVKGLHFAGEIIDTDAYPGGFNLQIAWATGRAAGIAAANIEE